MWKPQKRGGGNGKRRVGGGGNDCQYTVLSTVKKKTSRGGHSRNPGVPVGGQKKTGKRAPPLPHDMTSVFPAWYPRSNVATVTIAFLQKCPLINKSGKCKMRMCDGSDQHGLLLDVSVPSPTKLSYKTCCLRICVSIQFWSSP